MSTQRTKKRPVRPATRSRSRALAPRRVVIVQGRGDYQVGYKKKYQKYKSRRPGGANYQPSIGRSLLTGAGEAIGSMFGLGGVGKSAGDILSNIVGLGDYEIKQNVFLTGRLPVMENPSAGGGTIIRFQEYLGDVISASTPNTWDITSLAINPGMKESFPFLSQIAANYDQYSIEGMVFCFKSTSADALNSTNTALGTVIMATQYDSNDPGFSSKSEMLNYEFSSSCKPSENLVHMIECAPNQNTLNILYCRYGSPSGDIRMYDLGRLSIATLGIQGTSVNLGELHVTYQVRLLKPKLTTTLALNQDFFFATASAATAAAPLGTSYVLDSKNTMELLGLTSTLMSFIQSQFVQTYHISVMWTGYGTPANVVYPVLTATNGTVTEQRSSPNPASSCVGMTHQFLFITNGNGTFPTIAFGTAGTFPTAGSNVTYISIEQVPNGSSLG